MIQYQIERNKLIEYKSDDLGDEIKADNKEQEQKQIKTKWWQRIFK